jgi:hypothetical protein
MSLMRIKRKKKAGYWQGEGEKERGSKRERGSRMQRMCCAVCGQTL